ncbi:GTPase HflX [Neopusillimonas maritima]|jgi:GTP-binding protein HflX|uniref:GTPase HflX n=1 Tax=Neopusillimonas maritima TaxID=2026239 RepID=A0A3A1YQS0_9BURK|nr:GTPase HflX [Neopusillimonas maritima]MBF24393.1 GTPase HflX [Pusillimonas sp.]RII81996.1 GTPase HflX [Neopusillimonas maritima]RIY40522.1 GTPase HflX [Neopusillimonas maritima]|tara:strand:+ start:4587 stop:5684 length:1098 start_codon:yes stop_codon:yes gene_type:complete
MKSLIISVDLGNPDFQAHSDEFVMLAEGAGAEIVGHLVARRQRPDAAYFIGKGKLDEAALLADSTEAEIILFDQPLSPAQQRNIERALKRRVIDRVALILDIFALRAQSHEGKLQVELAQLQHLVTRLTRMWTHLERQRGGIGMRGPGESQLEMDKRMIGAKVKLLKERLAKAQKQRNTQRRARTRRGTMSVSLVGYTNAGKSTLFNALTRAGAYEADQLFATLDTTTRKLWIDGFGQVVVSDTVGFIRDLPPTLIAAFRATLEETVQADLLLHVVDAASPQRDEQIAEVNKVLGDIGAGEIPRVLVYNKIDAAGYEPWVERDEHGTIVRVFVSALTRAGLDGLRQAIIESGQVAGNNAFNVENI